MSPIWRPLLPDGGSCPWTVLQFHGFVCTFDCTRKSNTTRRSAVFLTNLIRQNPEFASAVIDLHQAGELPPDCYVLDLDTMAENARTITGEAHRLGMSVVAMTKQFGRNPDALRTLRENGVDS